MNDLVTTSSFSSFITSFDRDILAELLADKRSPNTRRAYAWDLNDFFKTIAQREPTPELLAEFLTLKREAAIAIVLRYKASLIERGLKEATVNRRLSAVRSLANYARKVGKCEFTLQDVEGEKVKIYRDTSGVEAADWLKVLLVPDRTTLKGKRDYAILRLLWDNVLRRNEIVSLNVDDFDSHSRTLMILGKGRGTQKEKISISKVCAAAVGDWLKFRQVYSRIDPLFVAVDNANFGSRLNGSSIHYLVSTLSQKAGIDKPMSPHKVRHSGITAALDKTNGDVRRVQKLSRHAKLDTLMIYDDNRRNFQGEVTELLADLADPEACESDPS